MPERSRALFYALAIFWATLVVYAKVVHFDFVSLDDPAYVLNPPHLRDGLTWAGLSWAFSTGLYGNWHPASWVSYMLDVAVHGGTPGGFHATNLALHVANALLLFGLLRSLTGSDGRSARVAGLFALHPLHVEPVAWVSARKDLLSTAFWLLSTWAWVSWTRRGGLPRYALAAVLLALGLAAKPMLVTLPATLLLLDVWPLRRTDRGAAALVLEKAPLFALAAASCIVTYTVQRRFVTFAPEQIVSFGASVANAIHAYAFYLVKAVVPTGLVAFYPHPFLPRLGGSPLSLWQIAGAAAGLVAITAGVFASRRRYLQVGWLWYLATLVPVIGLVQVRTSAAADRYTYVPLVGLFVMLAWGGAELAERWRLRAPAVAAAWAAVAACALVSFFQVEHWRNSAALYEHGLRVTPDNVTLLYNRARRHHTRGEVEAAMAGYRAVLQVDPASYDSNVNLGIALQVEGRFDEALVHLRRAVAEAPEGLSGNYNLANVLFQVGEMREAIDHYERALRARQDFAEAHYGIGNAYLALGSDGEAIVHYRRALEIRPEFPEARNNLERALSGGRRGLFAR